MLAAVPFASAVCGWLVDTVSLQNVLKGSGILFIIFAFVLYMLTSRKMNNKQIPELKVEDVAN